MTDISKKIDESWKERVEHERQVEPPAAKTPAPSGGQPPAPDREPTREPPAEPSGHELEARFDLFLSGLAMDALIALGELANPATRKQSVNLEHARYLIDLIGVFEEKTRGNLTADEQRLMKDTLYQLRMRYLAKQQA